MHLMIVSPIFRSGAGGASTYYDLLTRGLLDGGYAHRITVVSEKLPGVPKRTQERDGRLTIMRLFPHRASASMSRVDQYARYAWQNVLYFRLPALVREGGVSVVLVHSSFHNQANLMAPALRAVHRRAALVGDCRDHQMPPAKLVRLEMYDRIIVPSDNVFEHVAQLPSLRDRLDIIPVLQEPLVAGGRAEAGEVLAGAGLKPGCYILYAGLLKAAKGIGLLLDVYERYRQSEVTPLPLILVGLSKDAQILRRAQGAPGVVLLGAMERSRLLVLIKNAAINVNLSSSEGLPRVCLEALALGTRVLLPAGVPEFQRYCPDCVVASDQPGEVSEQLRKLLAAPPPDDYPISQHAFESVMPQYAALLNKVTR